jgi:hypothetical protein
MQPDAVINGMHAGMVIVQTSVSLDPRWVQLCVVGDGNPPTAAYIGLDYDGVQQLLKALMAVERELMQEESKPY